MKFLDGFVIPKMSVPLGSTVQREIMRVLKPHKFEYSLVSESFREFSEGFRRVKMSHTFGAFVQKMRVFGFSDFQVLLLRGRVFGYRKLENAKTLTNLLHFPPIQ